MPCTFFKPLSPLFGALLRLNASPSPPTPADHLADGFARGSALVSVPARSAPSCQPVVCGGRRSRAGHSPRCCRAAASIRRAARATCAPIAALTAVPRAHRRRLAHLRQAVTPLCVLRGAPSASVTHGRGALRRAVPHRLRRKWVK